MLHIGIGLDVGSSRNTRNSESSNESDENQASDENLDQRESRENSNRDFPIDIQSAANIDFPTLLNFDSHSTAHWLEGNLPYLIILFLLFLYKHKDGILVFIWLYGILLQSNMYLKNQIALGDNRQWSVLLMLILFLVIHIFSIYFIFREEKLWHSFLLMFPIIKRWDVWNVIWVVMINDFVTRFASIIIKSLVAIANISNQSYKRKQQFYGVIEIIFELYARILPIPLWWQFFLEENETNPVLAGLAAVGYMIIKMISLIKRARIAFSFTRSVFKNDLHFGSYATEEQIVEHGDSCPICQDKMTRAVILECSHLFCEDCVSKWFEKEKTCPICRAVVKAAGSSVYSDGTTPFLFSIF